MAPYSSTGTFMGVKHYRTEESRFLIQGATFDAGTTNRSGARQGPEAIRRASMMLADGVHPIYGVNPYRVIGDIGDVPISNMNSETALDRIRESTESLLRGYMVSWPEIQLITLGGDHTITLPVLSGMAKKYGPLQVVHIDAHTDCSEFNFDEPIAHGTWVRRAIEANLIDPTKMFTIGVRAPVSLSARNYLSEMGGHTITAEEAMERKAEEVATQILMTLDHNRPTYLSFDIDGLDPAYAPGTGTPEIGGLTTRWVLSLIRALQSLTWVGMDLVEVCPPYDQAEITSLAGATIIYNYICMNLAKEIPGKQND